MKAWNPVLLAIDGYRKYLSPRKGFCCAHRIATGGPSCSAFARQLIVERGLLASLSGIRERLRECKAAALQLHEKRKEKKDKDTTSSAACDKSCAAADAISCIPSGCADAGMGSIASDAAGGCDACACTPF